MKIFKNFLEIYNTRSFLPKEGWIYIKEDDFQDLENSEFYVLEKGEVSPDDYIETEDDVVPIVLYNINKTITGLIEIHTFNSIYDNMDKANKAFNTENKIEALYHYVEEDEFLY